MGHNDFIYLGSSLLVLVLAFVAKLYFKNATPVRLRVLAQRKSQKNIPGPSRRDPRY